MQNEAKLSRLIQDVNQRGVYVEQEIHGFPFRGIEMVVPHWVLFVCLSGNARAMYDRQEVRITRNTMAVIMPGHVLQPTECSDDYVFARIAVSEELFEDLNTHVFSHDYEKFHLSPACQLTDIQAKRIMAHFELIDAIAAHEQTDLKLKRQMLLAQMALAYEFINYYRREQNREWQQNHHSTLYARFSDLVVKHYRENRNVNFYAAELGYEPRYFSRLFRHSGNGMSPHEWIQQYVVTQAKRMMDEDPGLTVKETAYRLGFPTAANFCRYFKHVTGITAKDYRTGAKSNNPIMI